MLSPCALDLLGAAACPHSHRRGPQGLGPLLTPRPQLQGPHAGTGPHWGTRPGCRALTNASILQNEAAWDWGHLGAHPVARGQSACRQGWGVQDKDPLNPDPQMHTKWPHPTPTPSHSLSDELDGVFVLHSALDESQCHEDRSPGDRPGAGSSLGTPPLPRRAACRGRRAMPSPSHPPKSCPAPPLCGGHRQQLSPTTCCAAPGGPGTLSEPQAPHV